MTRPRLRTRPQPFTAVFEEASTASGGAGGADGATEARQTSLAVGKVAQNLIDTGQYQQAQALLEETLRDMPDDRYLLLMLGVAHRFQNQFPEALRLMEKAVGQSTDWLDGYRILARTYFRAGMETKAKETLENARRFLDPLTEAEQTLLDGYGAYFSEQYAGALPLLRATREALPEDDELIVALADCCFRARRYDEAHELYRILTERPAYTAFAWYRLGYTEERRKDYNAAARAYHKAVETTRDPTDTDWSSRLPLLYLKQGKLREAWKGFKLVFAAVQARSAREEAGKHLMPVRPEGEV